MIADLRIFGFYGRHAEGVRSRPLVGARPFSLRFLPLDTVSLFPPQFSPLLRCPRISRYFSPQDRRSMIYRKIFIACGDPPMWTEYSRAFTLHQRDEWNVPTKLRQVHTRVSLQTSVRMCTDKRKFQCSQIDEYDSHRCLLSTKRRPARKQKLASSFDAFVRVGNIQRACHYLQCADFSRNLNQRFIRSVGPTNCHPMTNTSSFVFVVFTDLAKKNSATPAIRRFDEREASQFVDPPVCCSVYREREREEERVAGAALGSCRPFSAIVALCCECSRTLENTRYCPAPGDPTITQSRYDLICIPPSSCLLLPSGVLLPSSIPLTHSLTLFLFLRGRGLRPCTPNHASIFTWCGGTKLPSSNIIRREFRWRDCFDPRSTGTSLLRMENLTRLELAVYRPMEAALSRPRSRRCSSVRFLCPRVFLAIDALTVGRIFHRLPKAPT